MRAVVEGIERRAVDAETRMVERRILVVSLRSLELIIWVLMSRWLQE